MGRRKLAMRFIGDKKKRVASFEKKKNGIIKKANELSILCGVQVCVIIFSIDEQRPFIWPIESEKLNTIISRYMSLTPQERLKNSQNLCLMLKKLNKSQPAVSMDGDKHAGNNAKIAGSLCDERVSSFSGEELKCLLQQLDSKLEYVMHRIDVVKRNDNNNSKNNNYNNQVLMKFEGIHSHSDEEQNMMMMGSYSNQFDIDPYHQQHHQRQQQQQQQQQFFEEQRRIYNNNAEMIMMRMGMMNNLNNNSSNFNVGEYSNNDGLFGGNLGKFAMWDPNPTPLQCYYEPSTLVHQLPMQGLYGDHWQVQAHQGGHQLPLLEYKNH